MHVRSAPPKVYAYGWLQHFVLEMVVLLAGLIYIYIGLFRVSSQSLLL